MVSFQCESCGDIFTKKKLDAHTNRCWNTSFTCLDCHTQFWNYDYKSHTSCISEAQKYEGALYKEKKTKARPIKTPRPATVEDIDSPFNVRSAQVVGFDVPPPAPTPPSAAPPLNVFDYMVPGSATRSPTSSSSSYVSGEEDSDRPSSPEPARGQRSNRPATTKPALQASSASEEPLYTYGSGPVETSHTKYSSTYDLNAQHQHTPHPNTAPPPYSSTGPLQTPGHPHLHATENGLSESRSDRKRKRSPDGARDKGRVAATSLQTGLTGGLNKLLTSAEEDAARAMEESPLSPKKRTKHGKEDKSSGGKDRVGDGTKKLGQLGNPRKVPSVAANMALAATSNGKEARRLRRHETEQKALEAPTRRKAIEYGMSAPARRVKQSPYQSNSEFFLSLVDKDHYSIKGQSIWGTLKTFHEERQEGKGLGSDGRQAEEKRLLKGLRCKINKQGEIVLFSRPAAEDD